MNMPLIQEWTPLNYTLEEGKEGKLVLRGEFGRVDTPTQNKRLYSRKITEREINRLNNDLHGRRVYGELDHPCVCRSDFRVLTAFGWKQFRDIGVGDRVWSRVDGKAVLSTVNEIIDQEYSGPAYRVRGRSIDSSFTPGHRFLAVKRPGDVDEEFYATIKEIAENPGAYAHSAIPKTAEWSFPEVSETFRVPGVQGVRRFGDKDSSKDLQVDSNVFAGFMGIYLSEGHCSGESVDNHAVFISQKTPWTRALIRDQLLALFPSDVNWIEGDDGFHCSDARLYAYLKPLGNCYEKRVPSHVKAMGERALKELLFWFTIGDGRYAAGWGKGSYEGSSVDESFKQTFVDDMRSGGAKYTRQDVFSVSERLVRDLHECLVKTGGCGSLSRIDPGSDYQFAGRTIRAEDKVPLHQLHISRSRNIWLDPRFLGIEEFHHDGRIFCLSVDSGNFYMEQNGKSFWTGNSDGKTKYQRVSHIITDLKIEDDGRVIGSAEILDTPNGKIVHALAKANGGLGVSSRGFGSVVTRQDGVHEVGEDFRLKTYDIVVDPAMKTAHPDVFSESIMESEDFDWVSELKADFPHLVEEIRAEEAIKAKEAAEKAVADVIALNTDEATQGQKEEFERRLKEVLVALRDEVKEDLREEFDNDPKRGAAVAVLEQISSLTAAFQPDTDEVAVRDAMKAKDVEAAKLREQVEEWQVLARDAGYKLCIERETKKHPMQETIISALGDLSQFKSVKDLKAAVDKIKEDLSDVIPSQEERDDAKVTEAIAAKDAEISVLKEQLEVSIESRADLSGKLQRAVSLSESLSEKLIEVQSTSESDDASAKETTLAEAKLRATSGFTNQASLLKLLENVEDETKIAGIVSEHGSKAMSDSRLEDLRQKLSRGDRHDGSDTLTEDGGPGPANRGASDSFMDQTANDILALADVVQTPPA